MARILDAEFGEALLPEYVFLEVVTVLAVRRSAQTAISTAKTLLEAREVTFVYCSDHFADTLETFRVHAGDGLSFADAAIVAIARSFDTNTVATFDRDFSKVSGIRILP
jgi:predicted nucleic acid-binding protein